MSYDDTSFYGDLIVDEYDDKNNFVGTRTSSGFYIYHILGDSFDMMSEQCSQFLNDFSILSANASSLDKFWGVSYNMPRPTLPISYSLIFSDDGVTGSKNSDWYVRSADAEYLSVTVDDEGTTLSSTDTSTSRLYFANPEHSISSSTNSPTITISDFVVECDVISTTISGSQINFYLQGMGTNFNLSSYTPPYHLKMEKVGTTVKHYVDDTLVGETTIDDTTSYTMGFQLYKTCSIKFKNYVIYDMDTPSTRPMTDEEYRVYLYLRNCQLLTMEDIEINMNKAFGTDDFKVYFSEETNYLNSTDHLVYTPTQTISSNLAKNNNDSSNDYVIKQDSDDSNVHRLEGNLSVSVDVIQVVNIPANNWDAEFLEFMQQYISVKGNVALKEYSI